jgi:triacylglycerol lipase
MNNKLKYLLYILLSLIIILIIFLFVKIILNITTFFKALSATFSNTKHCGNNNLTCPPTIIDPPIPPSSSPDNWLDISKFCSNMISRVSLAANKKTSIIYPFNISPITLLYNIKEEPIFGIMFMFKNILWIVFRGTLSIKEFMQDLDVKQTPFSTSPNKQNKLLLSQIANPDLQPSVHNGFLSVYNNFKTQMFDTINKYKPNNIVVTGHSLGAAVSTIVGLDIKDKHHNVVVYNFASPRVGDLNFCKAVKSINLPLFRIVNNSDIIPTLPTPVMLNLDEPDNPLMYIHCGTLISFTINWESVINNHLIPVYTKGLDTLKSTCICLE